MTLIDKKISVGISILILLAVTVVTGIILHLKKHGVVVEPRQVIKMIHWIAGFLMVGRATASKFGNVATDKVFRMAKMRQYG